MTFLYAVPGSDVDAVDYRAVGLDYAFEKSPQKSHNRVGIPDIHDGPMVVMSDGSTPPLISPDKQVWRKVGSVYVGHDKNAPPTPESLKRSVQLRGDEFEVRGTRWLAPRAVSFEYDDGQYWMQHHLSRYVDFDEEGEPTYGDVEAQYQPLFDIAMKWIETSANGGVTLGELWRWAADVMGFNYRVSFPELCMLKVLTDETSQAIMNICVDVQGQDELADSTEKKDSASGDSSTTAGGEGVSSDTSRPSPMFS